MELCLQRTPLLSEVLLFARYFDNVTLDSPEAGNAFREHNQILESKPSQNDYFVKILIRFLRDNFRIYGIYGIKCVSKYSVCTDYTE